MTGLVPASLTPLRCAIYTRRSVVRELDGTSGSLENQRNLCSAYVHSQQHRGWVELDHRYEDNGVSGGTLERPALQQLFADIQNGRVDVVIVYKLDRLTRSLRDFMRLIDLFDKFRVSFVCVTQAFDTGDSLGRLVLNILLTFAQFEREITADRMRDRIRALARMGRWIGGRPPFGYDLVERRLVINPEQAVVVRTMFERFVVLRSCQAVADEFAAGTVRTRTWVTGQGKAMGGQLIRTHSVYNAIGNRAYVGEIHYDGEAHPALHEPIVSRELWDAAQKVREEIASARSTPRVRKNLLVGLIYDGLGRRMLIGMGRRKEGTPRYYASVRPHHGPTSRTRSVRVDANAIEERIAAAIGLMLRNRFQITGAILKLGGLDDELEALLDQGPVAARRLENLDHDRLRLTYEILIRRIEVTREIVRVVLRCDAILGLLAWDGISTPRKRLGASSSGGEIHVLEFEAHSVRVERVFSLPVERRVQQGPFRPNSRLVRLIHMARAIQEAVHMNRNLTLAEIAPRFRRQPTYVARALRLNYLAPDIQVAILDGRHPRDLTAKRLIYGYIPMDWPQQRALLGFPPQRELQDGPSNYSRPKKKPRIVMPV